MVAGAVIDQWAGDPPSGLSTFRMVYIVCFMTFSIIPTRSQLIETARVACMW
jgi:hypothetical protein